MRKWQILEFDGKPYYAFVPENDSPVDESLLTEEIDDKTADASIKEEQLTTYELSDLNDSPYDDSSNDEQVVFEQLEESIDDPDTESPTKKKKRLYRVRSTELKLEVLESKDDEDPEQELIGSLEEEVPSKTRACKARKQILSEVDAEGCIKCKLCSETFDKSIQYRKHLSWTHRNRIYIREGGSYLCCVCDYRTAKKNLLISHVNRKHENLAPPKLVGTVYPCEACGFECRSKHSLQSHFIRKHTDRYEHQCKFCPKKFKVKGDLTNHVRFHHKEKPINCDVCGKLCMNSGSLYVHQKWAHYKPKFECEICHRRMVTQENLNQHMVSQHEKKEKIVCAECGKTFTKKDSFKRHMAVHTGNKPHTCLICQKSFARRSQLRQHLLIHTGKRPFVCDICGKAFTQKPGLICHRKIHPGTHPPLPVMPIGDIVKEFTENYCGTTEVEEEIEMDILENE